MSGTVESYKRFLDAAEDDAHEDHTFGCRIRDEVMELKADSMRPRERWRQFCDCTVRPRLLDIDAKRQIVAMYEETKAAARPSKGSRTWDLEVVSRSAKLATLGQVIEVLAAAHVGQSPASCSP